jgi:hypothetical protein
MHGGYHDHLILKVKTYSNKIICFCLAHLPLRGQHRNLTDFPFNQVIH